MKTAISIPEPIFNTAEQVAKELRLSRSELYTKAIKEFLETYHYTNAGIEIINPKDNSLKPLYVNALVDTGAMTLCIPEHIAIQLKLEDMDLVINPSRRTITVNPNSPNIPSALVKYITWRGITATKEPLYGAKTTGIPFSGF